MFKHCFGGNTAECNVFAEFSHVCVLKKSVYIVELLYEYSDTVLCKQVSFFVWVGMDWTIFLNTLRIAQLHVASAKCGAKMASRAQGPKWLHSHWVYFFRHLRVKLVELLHYLSKGHFHFFELFNTKTQRGEVQLILFIVIYFFKWFWYTFIFLSQKIVKCSEG